MKKTILRRSPANVYLDYLNNFLSIAKFAENYGVSEPEAIGLIQIGKAQHEARVDAFKAKRSAQLKADHSLLESLLGNTANCDSIYKKLDKLTIKMEAQS